MSSFHHIIQSSQITLHNHKTKAQHRMQLIQFLTEQGNIKYYLKQFNIKATDKYDKDIQIHDFIHFMDADYMTDRFKLIKNVILEYINWFKTENTFFFFNLKRLIKIHKTYLL